MNFTDAFSSSDQQNRQSTFSQGNRQNISTDIQRSTKYNHKTKNIKKKYQPIEQGGHVYHYEDDPQQYKRIRKKIQNRMSARRVRGRKQNAFQTLQQQVEYLRKYNSQLQLSNAKLQTQNKGLKDQLQFMKTLIKRDENNRNDSKIKPEDISQFLNNQTLTQPHQENTNSSSHFQSQYQSPFMEEESDWLRLPNRRSSSNSWAMFAVFTLVLAVFILPSQTPTPNPTVLFSSTDVTTTTDDNTNMQTVNIWFYNLIGLIGFLFSLTKVLLKYSLIVGYIYVAFKGIRKLFPPKKLKKI